MTMNASMRFSPACTNAISAPTSAVSSPTPMRTPRTDLADLCEGQGAGAAVEQRDPSEQEESADPVHEREVDRPWRHGTMLDPIAGQAEGGGAHQLEEDEHVEEVAGESETDHRRE